MASPILILTDDPESGNRLARLIGGSAMVRDLYDYGPPPTGARVVIGDIHLPHSDTINRLKRALAIARGPATPLLYLFHGSQERGEIQGAMLGATQCLSALSAAAILVKTLDALNPPPVMPMTPVEHVEAAREAFANVFSPEGPAHDLVDHGTEIVNRAIHDMRVGKWLSLVAAFDDMTHRHCLTVAGLAAAFASTLNFNTADAHLLTKGALLHDIGKARIPLEILNKPGRLTEPERNIMAQHAPIGYEMLQGKGFSEVVMQVVRSHHELLDGSGYPDGLQGSEIPDLVRLVTICDIFAALIERRPYKAPMGARTAYGIMSDMTGKLDADLLRAFGPVAFASDIEDVQLSA